MRQWMLRITAYADRLLADLDLLNWPESLKEMQRNWIGEASARKIDFDVAPPDEETIMTDALRGEVDDEAAEDLTISVFTTRPDTLFGATYLVWLPSIRWSIGSLPMRIAKPLRRIARRSPERASGIGRSRPRKRPARFSAHMRCIR
jgi:hypothetical protein